MSSQTITPEEWKKADDADRTSTVEYASKINKRVDDLHDRWLAWAKKKWGPSAFGSSVTQARLEEFRADKAEYGKFYEWSETGIPPVADSWRAKYSDVVASTPLEYLPGYWTRQYRKVILGDHDLRGFVDDFYAYTYEKPSPVGPTPDTPPKPSKKEEEPISQASVGMDGGSVVPWLVAGALAVWLFSRKNR